jgi:serine/arginine repetitive matrix protein 2
MGFKGLAKGGLVTKSPFLQQDEDRKSPEKLGSPIRLGGSPGRSALESGSSNKTTPPRFSGSPARFSSPSAPAKGDVFTLPTTVSAVPALKTTAQLSSSPYRQSPLSANTITRSEPKIEVTQQSNSPNVLPFPRADESPSPTNTPVRGLGQAREVATPTPTPSKSSITQRRLRGPRLSGGLESPGDRKQKTVTFRDGPVDVKEFDRESVTDDGSEARYESEDESDDHGGIQVGGFSSHHHADGNSGGMSVLDDSEDGHSNYDQGGAEESTTANFIDSLVEDGYFSPPTLDTPKMGTLDVDDMHNLHEQFEMPRLDTPSLGGSISATPIHEDMPFPMPPVREEIDEYGIPYGRTHHAERAAAAHAVEPNSSAHAPQPALPQEGASSGEPMLRSANAAEPSLQGVAAPQKDSTGPHAHQQGSFIDPFISIQTATKVYTSSTSSASHSEQRQEGGAPLGRTSHIERAKVARLVATQRLGLGMPQRPVIPNFMESNDDVSEDGSYQFEESDDDEDYSAVQEEKGARIREVNRQSSLDSVPGTVEPQRQISDASEQHYDTVSHRSSYIATSVLSPVGTPSSRRSLPKPPRPQQIDIPEPVDVHASSPEYESIAVVNLVLRVISLEQR